MSEINNSATCDVDGTALKHFKKETDTWRCRKCKTIYFSCFACEEEDGQLVFECNDSAKGWACDRCMHWFCVSHFQATGETDESNGNWYCTKCVVARTRIVKLATPQ